MLVDGNEQHFREARLSRLLHLEEGRAKRGPLEDELEEGDLGILRCPAVVTVVVCDDYL